MKIGIITFHWATNYGAVLQCYALQETLKSMGHDVSIINYKPSKYDNNLWTFFRYRKFLNIAKYWHDLNKEKLIAKFRENNLHMTKRYSSLSSLQEEHLFPEILITGSDQVWNTSFLEGGEPNGSTAYFLDFGSSTARRIGYAVSFGVTKYPASLLSKIQSLTSQFYKISTRENTGVEILKSLGINNVAVVPDPTLLLTVQKYKELMRKDLSVSKSDCFVYLLHNRYDIIKSRLPKSSHTSLSEGIEEWLYYISNAKFVVTNSFHGTVFSILFHVPFYVILPTLDNIGMNDRFYTLLSNLGLLDRLCLESEFVYNTIDVIDWDSVDKKLEEYRMVGMNFLLNSIR